MGDFSEDFNFIDDAFYGDGTTDATSQPLDSLIENLLESNTRWNVRHRHLAAFNFAGDDRIYASLYPMAIVYTPIYLDRGIDTITANLAASISSPRYEAVADTTPTLSARLRVLGLSAGGIVEWTGDGTLDQYSVTLDLDNAVQGTGWSLLMLEIRSQDDAELVGKTTFDTDGEAGYYLQAEAGGDDLSEGEYLSVEYVQGGFPLKAMPIGEPDFKYPGGSGSGVTQTGWPMLLYETAGLQLANIQFGKDIAKRSMSYIKPRSVHFSTAISDDREAPTYTPKPKAEMRSNEAVLGSHTGKHQQNISGVYTRQELKAIGPQMVEPSSATWGSKWQRWPHAYAADGADQSFGELSFMMDRDISRLTVNMWMCFHYLLDLPVPNFSQAGVVESDDKLKMSWDFDIKVLQASGASWSTATEIATESETVSSEPHSPFSYVQNSKIGKDLWYSYFHQDADGEDHYMWYEGGLITDTITDFAAPDIQFLRPVTVTVDVDKSNMNDFDRPVRLQVLASPDTSTIDEGFLLEETQTTDEDRIGVSMVTMAVHEAGK